MRKQESYSVHLENVYMISPLFFTRRSRENQLSGQNVTGAIAIIIQL